MRYQVRPRGAGVFGRFRRGLGQGSLGPVWARGGLSGPLLMADEGGDGVDVEEGADPGLQEVDMDELRMRLLKQSRGDDNVMLKELALLLKSGPLPGTVQDRDRMRALGQKVLHVVVVGPAEFRKLVIEMINFVEQTSLFHQFCRKDELISSILTKRRACFINLVGKTSLFH